MDFHLLEIIACPICKNKLSYNKENQELICKFDALAYPIRHGIPILLENEAHTIEKNKED